MHRLRILLAVAALFTVLETGPARARDIPALAVLEYSSGWFGKRAIIPARAGTGRTAFNGKSKASWTLREGETLAQATPPAERIIQFFQATDKDPELVCSIVVRYMRTARGWRPAYQLVPPAPLHWDGTKMIPLDTGLPGSVKVISTAGTTTDGFAFTLVFASNVGPLHIDQWEVQ